MGGKRLFHGFVDLIKLRQWQHGILIKPEPVFILRLILMKVLLQLPINLFVICDDLFHRSDIGITDPVNIRRICLIQLRITGPVGTIFQNLMILDL